MAWYKNEKVQDVFKFSVIVLAFIGGLIVLAILGFFGLFDGFFNALDWVVKQYDALLYFAYLRDGYAQRAFGAIVFAFICRGIIEYIDDIVKEIKGK